MLVLRALRRPSSPCRDLLPVNGEKEIGRNAAAFPSPRSRGEGARRADEGRRRRWPLALLLLLLSFPVLAQQLPALTGRVVDNAGLIDAASEEALTRKLAAFEQKSSDQIVVATVPDLGGEAIEPYANRLFRHWRLGQSGEDNGVLLLVSRDDRRMRIEVGYGLEGTLTDLHSKLIIENTMTPAFRNGDFAGGISAAVDDIVMVLEGDGAELEARARRNRQGQSVEDWIETTIIIVWVSLFAGAFLFAMLAPIFGRRLGPSRYKWLGITITYGGSDGSGRSSRGGWSSSGSSGWSSGGGGFSGGGGSSGGGGASGSW